MKLRIERVEVFGVAMPLVGEYKNAYLSKSMVKSAVVRITATGGAVGYGNIDPTPGYSKESIEEGFAPRKSRSAAISKRTGIA